MFVCIVFVRAGDVSLQFDPSKTDVKWSLVGNVHTVHGTFRLKRGTLSFDTESGKAAGELVVDILSGESGNGSRDKKMQKDVLESPKWPEAVFVADRVEGKLAAEGESALKFHGTLRLHGAGHELVLEAKVQRTAGDYVADTHFAVPYVKWGMKNPSWFAFKVEDTVNVEIRTLAHAR